MIGNCWGTWLILFGFMDLGWPRVCRCSTSVLYYFIFNIFISHIKNLYRDYTFLSQKENERNAIYNVKLSHRLTFMIRDLVSKGHAVLMYLEYHNTVEFMKLTAGQCCARKAPMMSTSQQHWRTGDPTEIYQCLFQDLLFLIWTTPQS